MLLVLVQGARAEVIRELHEWQSFLLWCSAPGQQPFLGILGMEVRAL